MTPLHDPSQPDPRLDPRLDAYLDGTLPPDQRDAMRLRLEVEPELRAAVESQRRIDASLRRRFEHAPLLAEAVLAKAMETAGEALAGGTREPAEPVATAREVPAAKRNGHAAHGPAKSAPPARPTDRYRILQRLATAAVLVFGVGAIAWMVQQTLWPHVNVTSLWADNRPAMGGTPLEIEYRQQVARGFKPLWVCETEQQFIDTFKTRLGKGVTLAAAPAGIKPLGLSYPGDYRSQATIMLAQVHGTPVLVWIDRAAPIDDIEGPGDAAGVVGVSAPVSPHVGPGCGLHVFTAELDGLVLHEVTPLRQPHLLALFRAAERPDAGGAGDTPTWVAPR